MFERYQKNISLNSISELVIYIFSKDYLKYLVSLVNKK